MNREETDSPLSNNTSGDSRLTKHGSSDESGSNQSDNIKVYVRVRPPAKNLESEVDRTPCLEVTSGNTIQLQCKPEPKSFTYDHVADINTTQEEVFGAVGKRIVEGCVAGYNGTIFAYGQTGSGKTFTMLGPAEGEADCFTHQLRGVIPRGFEYLFSLINREIEKQGDKLEFLCRCSFLEIYNEQIFDLLDPASTGLPLREDIKRGVFVDGLLERDVTSARDAYRVLNSGWLNRRVASTSMNRESSRSHAVFTVTLESKEKKGTMSNIKVSKLHLVDLAGSERQKDTHAEGLRLKEASSINRSLSALGNVIMALVDITHGKQRHVHYRDSKLTFLLRDSLGGNARTYIIANVHPSARCFGETLSTLNFARRAKMIKNKPFVNEDTTGSITALQAEIRRLREELAASRAGIKKQVTKNDSTDPDNDSKSRRMCTCGAADGNNNSSNGNSSNNGNSVLDFDNRYKEWKQMMVASIAARDQTEHEKQALVEKVQKLEELCSKKEKFLQSTKMILKFRENHIGKLERMRQKDRVIQGIEDDDRDREIDLLKEEIRMLKENLEHHPDVTRFAMENLELRAEVKRLKMVDPEGNDLTQDLAKSHRYTLQLERQLRDLLQSPQGSELEKSLSSSMLSLEASNAELEKYRFEQGQLQAALETAREELQQTRENLQQLKEKLVGQEESSRKKLIEVEANFSAAKKANEELEGALEALQLKTAVERTTLNDIHMQTVKTLTTPRKVNTPNRQSAGTNSGTPKRGSPMYRRPHCKFASPDNFIVDEKPPNGVFREDSFNESGSDSEFDEPFFNFDSEECDAEEQYAEALRDELKKLQDMNNNLLQQLQSEEARRIKLHQASNKFEYQAQQLNTMLANERENHAAVETELNMKNLGLADKLKEGNGELTVLRSEVEDLRIMLQAADRKFESLKKEKDLENIEQGRLIATLESKLTRLEIDLFNNENEMEKTLEINQRLQVEVETIRDELQFDNHKISEYEQMLASEKSRVKEMEQELQNALEKLEIQTETNVRLLAPESQQTEVLALEECVRLKTELQKRDARCETELSKVRVLENEIAALKENITVLDKRNESDKDCMNNLIDSVKQLKKTNGEKETELSQLRSDLEETKLQERELRGTIDEKDRAISKLKEKLNQESDLLSKERKTREAEILSMREDLRRTAEQCKELTSALEEQQTQMGSIQAELKRKTDQVKSLQEDIVKAHEESMTQRQVLESRVLELQDIAQSNDVSAIVDSKLEQVDMFKENQAKLQKVIEHLEKTQQEKIEEIDKLKSQLKFTEKQTWELEIAQTQKRSLETQLENEKEESEGRKSEIERLNSQLAETEKGLNEVKNSCEQLKVDKVKLEDELARAIVNLETAQLDNEDMSDELERIQVLEQQMFNEKEDMKSLVETLKEEKLRLQTTIKRVEEENARLSGHQNPHQKLHHLLAIKKENNALKERTNKLEQELQKCCCTKERKPLATKNSSENSVRLKSVTKSCSSEEGENESEKENLFSASV